MDQEADTTGLLGTTCPGGTKGVCEHPAPRRPEHADTGAMAAPATAAPGRWPTYAALDLGTNNCRLLVARPTGNGFRVIDAFSRIIRLGEGVSRSGRIGEAAIGRAVEALAVCRDKMRARGVTRARLIATEACRAAENGADFQSRIRDLVGLDLEIVDRRTEAELAATGCTPLMDPGSRGAILFDIGGGSSELVRLGRSVVAGRGPPKPVIEGWVSLPVGVVTLAERFGGVTVDRGTFDDMVAEVGRALADFSGRHGGDLGGLHMLGTSGTVTTIAGVHLALPRYDRRRVDGCWLRAHEITAVIDRLMAMSYQDRVDNPCIGGERADLVLAGCAILEAIRRAFPCPRLRVADRGLREGILVKMMRADGVWDRG
ncbi:Guanosine-5'-triphosphate,3'-diphosphate pyrophosphatase [Rhodoplanes serenus]|uniref:Guanosine-5'-triphosphate,3'-diphosphate pyrophosphatase n=2 Tax=Nitrobacteraceae TaxID=41294 RepID=A0A447CPY9_9BRAD|nr:Guanosine-5'-triphosphate,3'-diphosphate pyrophosphatase [Rhodoplanes serenus]